MLAFKDLLQTRGRLMSHDFAKNAYCGTPLFSCCEFVFCDVVADLRISAAMLDRWGGAISLMALGGGDMGTRHGTTAAARRLVRTFLREIDMARTCTAELSAAIAEGDRPRVIVAIGSLHRAWLRAQAAIFALETCSGANGHEGYARDAFRASYFDAGQRLIEAGQLLGHDVAPAVTVLWGIKQEDSGD
jgi:hypothetical protein